MQTYFLATNDVESTSIRYNKQRPLTAEKVLRDGMPLLLDLYARLGVKVTFFFTGEIAQRYPEIVSMVIPGGHEVASHGYSHEDEAAFDKLSYSEQVSQLRKSKELLEDIAGTEVISFRAPALRINEFTPRALEAAGFTIDSSISSQRADFIFSFGGYKKINRLLAPRLPYLASRTDLAKKGDSKILEVPISSLFFPYIGTFMRINPLITRGLRSILYRESKINAKPINFLIHPNELIIEDDLDSMHRRSSSFLQYVVAEKLRTKLKLKNLGSKALELYAENLHYFHNRKFKFVTLTQYRKELLNDATNS